MTFDDVIVEGIQKITDNDIRYARDMGYIIKLLAVGLRQDQGISLNVYPALSRRITPWLPCRFL